MEKRFDEKYNGDCNMACALHMCNHSYCGETCPYYRNNCSEPEYCPTFHKIIAAGLGDRLLKFSGCTTKTEEEREVDRLTAEMLNRVVDEEDTYYDRIDEMIELNEHIEKMREAGVPEDQIRDVKYNYFRR